MCYGGKSGFATLLVSEQFCTKKRSWKSEERCTAILFRTTLVGAAYAPDSGKSTEMYEAFDASVLESAARRTSGSQRLVHYRRSQCGMGGSCVEMRRTSRSLMRCMDLCAGKGTSKTQEARN